MAKCEEGYLCEVCGGDVEAITDSDLYLRYVIGELDPEVLHMNLFRALGLRVLSAFDEAIDRRLLGLVACLLVVESTLTSDISVGLGLSLAEFP